MTSELFDYGDAGRVYQGYLSFPQEDGPSPCVFVLHDWSGVSESTHEAADRLARLGYVAFAVDLYGKGRRGRTPERSAALMQPFLDQRQSIMDAMAHAMTVAKSHPRIDASRMAAVGFCFGGLCALDLARRELPLLGIVSVHGVLTAIPEHRASAISAKILVLHGSEDPIAPPSQIRSLTTELDWASADWQLHLFGGVRHAFTNPAAKDPAAGIEYDAVANDRAWRLAEGFFEDVFKTASCVRPESH